MPGGLFARAFGGQTDTLQADLKRVTESGVLEIPEDLLKAVAEHTQTEAERQDVMRHLRECLAESSGKRWKRVYAGLALIDYLAKHASPELLVETAGGRHFDLIQRLSLLEVFELSYDKRAQSLVRNRAKALRTELVPRLQTIEDVGGLPCDAMKDSASTCSPGTTSSAVSSSALTAVGSSGSPVSDNGVPVPPYEKPTGQMILNGIVAVGHTDDTTSESDNDDGPRRAVQYRDTRSKPQKARGKRANGSSDSDEPRPQPRGGAAVAVAAQKPAAVVDLLEL